MSGFSRALAAEILKTRRSLMPILTFLGMSLGPLIGGFFMVILKDPDQARQMGMISAKAHLVGTADWPTFLGLLAQVIGMGGFILFGFVAAWVFGREFAERTARQWLAVPTPRSAVLTAKFAIVAGWCGLLSAWVFGLGLAIGLLVGMPGFAFARIIAGAGTAAGTAGLTIALLTMVACLASLGRGYLAALGFVFLTMFLGQIAGVAGWGEWFPWAVPALFSGAAGTQPLGAVSYIIVALTSIAGLAATYAWWTWADHTN